MIPLVDLNRQYRLIDNEIIAGIRAVIATSSFVQGKTVEDFAAAFAARHQCAFGVGCSSGTSALALALMAMGIGPGDEVITSPHTFVATAEAIWHAGAVPVFVDIDPVTYGMDVARIPSVITARTKAVIPVHLYGHPVDMTALMALAREHGFKVIEDCAQAHDASWQGRMVGSFGDAAAFSFYPGKNLGAYGDAGIMITPHDQIAARVAKLLNHGRAEKYLHDVLGYNHRMDDIQASILQVKMRHLGAWTDKRRAHAREYNRLLEGCSGLVLPAEAAGARHVYHLYVVRTPARDGAAHYLKEQGISTGIHYPVPVHLQPAFRYLGYGAGDFPESERAAGEILSLPMFPELEADEIMRIARALKGFLKR